MPPRRTVRDEGFPSARGSLSWVDSFSRDASKVFRVVFCREGRQQSDEGEGRRESQGGGARMGQLPLLSLRDSLACPSSFPEEEGICFPAFRRVVISQERRYQSQTQAPAIPLPEGRIELQELNLNL